MSWYTDARNFAEGGFGGSAVGGPIGSFLGAREGETDPNGPRGGPLRQVGGGIILAGAGELGGAYFGGGGSDAAPYTGDSSYYGGEPPPLDVGTGGGPGGIYGDPSGTGGDFLGDLSPYYAPTESSGLSSYIPSMSQIASGLMIGAGGLGIYNSLELRRQRRFEDRRRKEFQSKADELMNNPSSITGTPGYKFELEQGNEALARRMASLGYGSSGNLAIATQRYGQDYASTKMNQQLQMLSQSYGVGDGSGVGPTDPIQVAMRSLYSLGYGMRGV